MKSRFIVGSLVLLGTLALGAVAARGASNAALKWAVVNLTEPTSIAGAFASGPVLFVHDDEKMARGEPCTGVYHFVPGKGPGEEIVSFHCTPRWGKAPDRFRAAVVRDPAGPPVLTEYTFAADPEAHGVPTGAHRH